MYSLDIYKEPFWAENSGFKTGIDPLGIQNSSFAVYSRLLSGMTNQTSRIRYYGFYCWLLNEYDKLDKKYKKSNTDQYNFIRRAELLLAFLMHNNFTEENSIVGSLYVSQNNDLFIQNNYYDLSEGADNPEKGQDKTVYWQYRSGALGQYYAGALISLRLIEIIDKYFHILNSGKELADYFKNNISDKAANLFIQIVLSGKVRLNQLNDLEEFAINRIHKKSKEWKFYVNLLLNNDGGDNKQLSGNIPSYRRETIKYYLEFLDRTSNQSDFTEFHYSLNQIKTSNDASFGWYYYDLIEMLHYSIESIFWSMLVNLDGKITPVDGYMNYLTELIIKNVNQDFNKVDTLSLNQVLDKMISQSNRVLEHFNQLTKLVKSTNDSKEVLSLAFKIILELYIKNESHIEYLKQFETLNHIDDKNGNVCQIFESFVTHYKDVTFEKYVKNVIRKVINDHITTAYRKMGNSESNLLKFMIEDNNIIHIQTMDPSFTSPRIGTLLKFLEDLGFIENNTPTKDGYSLLIEITT